MLTPSQHGLVFVVQFICTYDVIQRGMSGGVRT